METSRERPRLRQEATLLPLLPTLIGPPSGTRFPDRHLPVQAVTRTPPVALKPKKTAPTTSLSPAQRLLFWRIAAAGGSAWLGSIHPLPPPALRRTLENSGLVIQRQLPDPLTGRQATQMEITDRGWRWAQANMGGTFSNSPGAAETLSVLLEALAAFLRKQNLEPIDLFTATAADASPKPAEEPDSLVDSVDDRLDTPAEMIDAGIVRQIVTLTSGRTEVPIPLRSLRRLLDIHHGQWEDSLRRLQRNGQIELMPAPSLQAISVEDREAVFFDEQGNPVLHVQLTRQLAISQK